MVAFHIFPIFCDMALCFPSKAMEWNIKAWKADLKLFEYAPERFTIYIGFVLSAWLPLIFLLDVLGLCLRVAVRVRN